MSSTRFNPNDEPFVRWGVVHSELNDEQRLVFRSVIDQCCRDLKKDKEMAESIAASRQQLISHLEKSQGEDKIELARLRSETDDLSKEITELRKLLEEKETIINTSRKKLSKARHDFDSRSQVWETRLDRLNTENNDRHNDLFLRLVSGQASHYVPNNQTIIRQSDNSARIQTITPAQNHANVDETITVNENFDALKDENFNIWNQYFPQPNVKLPAKEKLEIHSNVPAATSLAVVVGETSVTKGAIGDPDRRAYLSNEYGNADFNYASVARGNADVGSVDQWNFFKPSEKFTNKYKQSPHLVNAARQEDQVAVKKGSNLIGYPILLYDELTTPYVNEVVKIKNENGTMVSPFDEIVKEFKASNFFNPKPVQKHCWSSLMSGCDLMGIAPTGSGKTLAFAIPAIFHIIKKDERTMKLEGKTHVDKWMEKGACPDVLVLAPTRELAGQIHRASERYLALFNLNSLCVFGGEEKAIQSKLISHRLRFLVGTPGRLQDFVFKDKRIHLNNVSFFVIDEADRMLDLGFGPEVLAISRAIDASRQCAFFSATWTDTCQDFADKLLRNKDRMIHVHIGGEGHVITIRHDYRIKGNIKEKDAWLRQFLGGSDAEYPDSGDKSIMVFCATKRATRHLFGNLNHDGYEVCCMEGDMEQNDRDKSLADFKSGKKRILICTPVAERGIDVEGVGYVVSYNAPKVIDDYTHRAGRTGRAGRQGVCIQLYTKDEQRQEASFAREIMKIWHSIGKGIEGNADLLELQDFVAD